MQERRQKKKSSQVKLVLSTQIQKKVWKVLKILREDSMDFAYLQINIWRLPFIYLDQ